MPSSSVLFKGNTYGYGEGMLKYGYGTGVSGMGSSSILSRETLVFFLVFGGGIYE
jgi:hypothetical protein